MYEPVDQVIREREMQVLENTLTLVPSKEANCPFLRRTRLKLVEQGKMNPY